MALGHALFPAVSPGTLLILLSDGLTSSSSTSSSLPLNNQPAFQIPSELFPTRVCLSSAGTFPKFCLVQSKFRSPCSGAKMLRITDPCQVQMRLAQSCEIRQGESCLCRIPSTQERRQRQPTCRQGTDLLVCTKPGISSDLLSGISCATSEAQEPQRWVIFASRQFLQVCG